MWDVINDVRNKNVVRDKQTSVSADQFNIFFTNIVDDIIKSVPNVVNNNVQNLPDLDINFNFGNVLLMK